MQTDIMAIDIHSHLNHGALHEPAPIRPFISDSSLEYLQKMYDAAKIDKAFYSTFSSVLSTEVVEAENQYLYELSQNTKNVYQWVVIDPRNDNTFVQADKMLDSKKCVGIKLHPPGHKYNLYDFGDKIFSFASERKAIVLIHPEADADYILPLADKYQNVTFIAAHTETTDYERAINLAKCGNVYTDTSGIMSSGNHCIEYIVEKTGSEKILFGTDTYAAGFQRGRIEYALISDKDKKNILRCNAEKLFRKNLL